MSQAQAIAVGQHYGCPTPLLDISINPEVALYFATSNCESDTGALHFFKVDRDNRQILSEMALVIAPPQFTRIHLQSGFFLCTQPGISLQDRFQSLKFLQSPELTPIRPTWLPHPQSFTSQTYGREALLEDEFDLEAAFRTDLPSASLPPKSPSTSLLADFDSQRIIQWMAPAYINATANAGVQSSGRAAFYIDPALTYVVERFSQAHCYLYVATLMAHKVAGTLEPVFAEHLRFLLDLFRVIAAEHIEVDGSSIPTQYRLDDLTMLRLMGASIAKNTIPFPLSDWYK